MNQEHMNALAMRSMSRSLTHNGVDLWSDGNILVTGKVEGSKELDSIAKIWDESVIRAGELPITSLGPLHSSDRGYSREMASEGRRIAVFINETYRVLLSYDGSAPFVLGPKLPIVFRKDGALTGVCMPMTCQYGDPTDSVPTESQLFESFACRENDWYLQGSTALRRELAKIEEEIETAEEKIADLESEVRVLESQADGMRRKISAKEVEQAGGTHAPQGKAK